MYHNDRCIDLNSTVYILLRRQILTASWSSLIEDFENNKLYTQQYCHKAIYNNLVLREPECSECF